MADLNSLIRNPYVVGAGAIVVIAATVGGGYFLGRGGSMATKTSTTVAEVPHSVCGAALARLHNYGIVAPSATMTSEDATTTATKDRMVCTATAGNTTYTITVDAPCDDMSDPRCLNLYKVTDSNGATLYQRTKFLKPQP